MDFDIILPKLYLKGETSFDHNKYPLVECISCLVTETTDGIFDLDLEYPLKDKKNLSGLLVRGNIIKCPISTTDARGEQLFTIRTRTPSISNNSVKIYAQAIARRDLDLNMILGFKTTPGVTRKQAIQLLLSKCVEPHNYIVGNLDTNTVTSINLGLDEKTGTIIDYVDLNGVSPRKALLAEDSNSVFKAWGGEIIYNNFELNMVDERGIDNSFEIRSGKNLEELEQTIDDTDLENLATAILPVSSDGYYLPNSEIIYSPNVSVLGKIFKKTTYDDVSLAVNTAEGLNVLYAQLRERVQKDFDNGIDKLKINNTVKFTQLANTEEYKNYAILEKCEIGNNVTIKYYEPYDIEKKTYIEAVGRVLKIKFNVLTNRIEEVEVGDRKKKNIITTINNTASATTTINDKVNETNVKVKDAVTESKNYSDDIKVVLEARDTEIEASVTNETANRVSAINILDGEIKERVTTADYNAEIDILVGQIEAKVEKEGFGAYLKMFYNEIMASVYDGTNHTVTLNSDGLSVGNGAFTIRDINGNIIFRINTNGAVGMKDLDMVNGSKDMFYNTLYSMDYVSFHEVKVTRLTIDESDFYITIDGDSGYSLNEAIDKRLEYQGLI